MKKKLKSWHWPKKLNRWHSIPHGELCFVKKFFFYYSSSDPGDQYDPDRLFVFLGIRHGSLKLLEVGTNDQHRVNPSLVVPVRVHNNWARKRNLQKQKDLEVRVRFEIIRQLKNLQSEA